MIRLTAMLRRNPALSAEQFHAHWRDVHAPRSWRCPGIGERVLRYEQHPGSPDAPGQWTGSDGFDGVTVQWYEDLAGFAATVADPEYRRIVGPDERALLDRAGSVYLLTDEPRLVIG